jgi:hypothetical protein
MGKGPFQDFNSNQIIEHVALLYWRLPLREHGTPPGKLITQCWSKDPAERPAFAEITRKFHQDEVEFEPCERINWDTLNKNHCPPLNMPYAQEGH